MVYFSPTIRALRAHIVELQMRLASSEAERQQLQDRLLLRVNASPIHAPDPLPGPPALQVIAPPGVALPEVQDAVREVWIREEAVYYMDTLGYDEQRAWSQAQAEYIRQHQA